MLKSVVRRTPKRRVRDDGWRLPDALWAKMKGCCRRGQSIRWGATIRACRTGRRWTRSSSCCAPAASGTRCERRRSAPPPRPIGASRNGLPPGCSRPSGAKGCWPMMPYRASTGVAGAGRGDGQGAAGREKTGPNPTDRGKRGVKRSILTDGRGVPLGAVIDGANRNDHKLR